MRNAHRSSKLFMKQEKLKELFTLILRDTKVGYRICVADYCHGLKRFWVVPPEAYKVRFQASCACYEHDYEECLEALKSIPCFKLKETPMYVYTFGNDSGYSILERVE